MVQDASVTHLYSSVCTPVVLDTVDGIISSRISRINKKTYWGSRRSCISSPPFSSPFVLLFAVIIAAIHGGGDVGWHGNMVCAFLVMWQCLYVYHSVVVWK